MNGKVAADIQGLTAQEIWDAHFRNELEDGGKTEPVWRAAGFLVERGYYVWEYREAASGGTVWRDGLDRRWLVDPATEDIDVWDG